MEGRAHSDGVWNGGLHEEEGEEKAYTSTACYYNGEKLGRTGAGGGMVMFVSFCRHVASPFDCLCWLAKAMHAALDRALFTGAVVPEPAAPPGTTAMVVMVYGCGGPGRAGALATTTALHLSSWHDLQASRRWVWTSTSCAVGGRDIRPRGNPPAGSRLACALLREESGAARGSADGADILHSAGQRSDFPRTPVVATLVFVHGCRKAVIVVRRTVSRMLAPRSPPQMSKSAPAAC